jgi:hypothetical protein
MMRAQYVETLGERYTPGREEEPETECVCR